MKALLAVLFTFCVPVSAATYYVRTDGAVPGACDGTADLPATSPPHCAWSNPAIAFPAPPYGGNSVSLLATGDTLKIAGGQYPIGWSPTAPNPGTRNCNAGNSSNCGLYVNGTNIHVIGDPANPAQLYGIGGVYSIFSVDNSVGLEIGNLELTDHSSCMQHNYYPSDACSGNTSAWGQNGISGKNITGLNLHDLNIHDFGNEGVRISKVHGMTATNTSVDWNAEAGWDFDNGSGDTSSDGAMIFNGGEIVGNGCSRTYPENQVYACVTQNQGGYGDGLGLPHSSGDWQFHNMTVARNGSDGLDTLYLASTGTVLYDHINAFGNAGNQLKSAGNATVQYSMIDGSCAQYFASSPREGQTSPPVPSFMGLYGFDLAGTCRADGIALSFANQPNHHIRVIGNTIIGQGNGLVTTTNEAPGDSNGATIVYANNILDCNNHIQWQTYATGGGVTTQYGTFDYNASPANTHSKNIEFGCKDGQLAAGDLNVDPQLTNPSPIAFNPLLLAGSPAIGAGDPTYCGGHVCNIGADATAPPPQQCTNTTPPPVPICPDGVTPMTGGVWNQAPYPGCGWTYVGGVCPVVPPPAPVIVITYGVSWTTSIPSQNATEESAIQACANAVLAAPTTTCNVVGPTFRVGVR